MGALLFWSWINPRFFGRPITTKHWASKAVFGERVWLRKDELPIADHHLRAITVLNSITGSGLPFIAWGLYELHIWSALLGLTLVILGKMWFLDRMVWVYEDMKHKSEEYFSWEYRSMGCIKNIQYYSTVYAVTTSFCTVAVIRPTR